METVAKDYAGSGGSHVPLGHRSFVPRPETCLLPLKYILRVNDVSSFFRLKKIPVRPHEVSKFYNFTAFQVNVIATSTETWMLLSDYDALRREFSRIDFRCCWAQRIRIWVPLVKLFLAIEVPDELERANYCTSFFAPLADKKKKIFDSEFLN